MCEGRKATPANFTLLKIQQARKPLIARLEDRSSRVRFFAAISLGQLGDPEAVEPLIAMLRANDGRDAYLRHAGIQGLVSYYANSFVCEPTDQSDAIAWSEYAGVRFTAALRRANTWGLQFHPEKSSTAGRRIVTNFVKLARGAR